MFVIGNDVCVDECCKPRLRRACAPRLESEIGRLEISKFDETDVVGYSLEEIIEIGYSRSVGRNAFRTIQQFWCR